MRILLITRYFPPLNVVATNRMVSWAKYWSLAGHDVTVCTTAKGEKGSVPFPCRILEIPYFDPITFVSGDRLKEHASSSKGMRSQLASMAMRLYRSRLNERLPSRTAFWPSKAKKRLLTEPSFDLIVSSYGPPTAHFIGYWAKRHFGCPWFADFRDLWVKNDQYLGVWPFTIWERFLERQMITNADVTMTVSNGLKKVLQYQYANADIRVIPNGYDPDHFQGVSRRKRGSKFSLVYTGTLYDGKHDPRPLFESLKRILQIDSSFSNRFEITFYGSATKHLSDLINRYGLSRMVYYRGIISHREALQVQADADALLLFNFENAYDGILTGKVYEYLASKRPILALGIDSASELGCLIDKVGGGILCPNQVEEITKILTALAKGQFSHQGDQKALELYSRKHQAELITSWALKCSQRTISSSE